MARRGQVRPLRSAERVGDRRSWVLRAACRGWPDFYARMAAAAQAAGHTGVSLPASEPATTQMLARLAIGVLREGWRLVHERFIGKPIGRDYQPLLDQGGQRALAELKLHFGQSNLLVTIRDDFAYHHPRDDDVEAAFDTASRETQLDQEWNWYLSEFMFNSFYFPCELVILCGILNATSGTDLIAAQGKIMDEVRKVSDLLMDFIPAFAKAVWLKHFGPEMQAEICAQIQGASSLWEVSIPFFVEVPPAPSS